MDTEPGAGPPLHVLATYPADGDGDQCGPADSADCGVPTNVAIELRLDRFIRLTDGLRQAVILYSGDRDRNRFAAFEPEYDMVERVVTFKLRGGALLAPGALYTLEIVEPAQAEDQGLHAFDGAALEPGPVPLRITFTTWTAPPEPLPAPVPPPADCSELLAEGGIFFKCSGCHALGEAPPMGLALAPSPDALAHSAIGQVAHETETGNTAGRTLRDPVRFGVEMPIIDPGFPANSYILYKLLRSPENSADENGELCKTVHRVPLPPGVCVPADEAENTRLREWFVRGQPMPPAPLPPDQALRRSDLDRLSAWIGAGAPCRLGP